jgi:competence protein ComGC
MMFMRNDQSSRLCENRVQSAQSLFEDYRLLKPRHGQEKKQAFTCVELILLIGALALLALLALPALAQSKPRSQQAICFNNLRAVGQAVLLFNAENNQLDPWRASWASGSGPAINNVFFHYYFLSNGCSNPKVFACPSDELTRPASDYSVSTNGGFLGAGYRNQAVSYFIGLDSSVLVPNSVLSGDRNIGVHGSGACISGIQPVAAIYVNGGPPIGWRSGVHGAFGNILLHDGRVEQTSGKTVDRLFTPDTDDNGSVHLMIPPR